MLKKASREAGLPVLALALLATPTSLSANATTTVIPELALQLEISLSDATWAATAFGWGAVLGTPLVAAILRMRGTRTAVLVNAALVLAGSLLVLVAPTLPVLLAGRAAQAIGGGGLITLAITLAGTARRTGAITAGVGLVGAFGPVAGATLSELSWRLPLSLSLIALCAVPVVLNRIPAERPSREPGGLDLAGIGLVLGLVSAVVLLPRFSGPALVVMAVLVVLLAAHIRRRPEGFVPRALMRSPAFLVPAVTAFALSTSYFALLYTVPRSLAEHWTVDRIGVATLIALAAGSVASLLFTRYLAGTAWALVVVLVTGAGALALPLAEWPPAEAAATGVAVFAMTAGVAWFAGRVRENTAERHRATALSLLTLSYQLGGAFGPALATLFIATP